MYKRIFFYLAASIFLQSFAQTPVQKIDLVKGQKIMVTDSMTMKVSQEAMGQTVELNASSKTLTQLEVKDVADNKKVITSTLQKVRSSFDAMGQSSSYDSEKPGDNNSEAAKAYETKLNKPEEITIDNLGKSLKAEKVVVKKPAADNSGNPMDALMNMSGNSSNTTVENAFMILPAGIKPGATWTDSAVAEGIKTIHIFILKSILQNEGVVTLMGVITGNKKMEMQGMDLTAVIGGKVDGEILIDISTGRVKKTSSVTEMNNSVEVMGQTVPVTGKIISVSTYTPIITPGK